MCLDQSATYRPRHDKTNKMSMRPAKTQISLGIRLVWSESSVSAWRNLGSLATHWVHSEDSNQTGRMPRLIWVFAGCTLILLVLSCCGSITRLHKIADYKTERGKHWGWNCERIRNASCDIHSHFSRKIIALFHFWEVAHNFMLLIYRSWCPVLPCVVWTELGRSYITGSSQ